MLYLTPFGIYWHWYAFDLQAVYWSQYCRISDRRRVLDFHEPCPF